MGLFSGSFEDRISALKSSKVGLKQDTQDSQKSTQQSIVVLGQELSRVQALSTVVDDI